MSETVDERQLVALAQSGDLQAFGVLYDRYSTSVFNVVLRMLGSRDDAEDVRQEVFLKAWRSLKSFKGDSRLGTWLYRIAANMSLDEIRRRKPSVSSDALGDEFAWEAEATGAEANPELLLEQKATAEAVQEALSKVPAHYRILLVLRHLEDLSYEEIAAISGCSLGSLNVRLHRARQAFKKAVTPLLNLEDSSVAVREHPKANIASL